MCCTVYVPSLPPQRLFHAHKDIAFSSVLSLLTLLAYTLYTHTHAFGFSANTKQLLIYRGCLVLVNLQRVSTCALNRMVRWLPSRWHTVGFECLPEELTVKSWIPRLPWLVEISSSSQGELSNAAFRSHCFHKRCLH